MGPGLSSLARVCLRLRRRGFGAVEDLTPKGGVRGVASRPIRWIVLTSLASVLALGALATPAAASSDPEPQIVMTGEVVVSQGQTVGDVVIFNGPATIDGTVRGSVTSFNGDVSISGRVTGDVTSFNGRVTVADGARIGGDVSTRSRPAVAAGATIAGSRQRVPVQEILGRIGWISRIAFWVAITVLTLVFGLLLLWFAPRAGEAVALAARERVGASIGWGILRVGTIVPFLGGLVWFATTVYGLGALAVAARGAGRIRPPAPPPMPVPSATAS